MTAHQHIHPDRDIRGFGRRHRSHHLDEAADRGPRPERGRGMGFGPGFAQGFGPGRMPFMGRQRPTRRGEVRSAILALLAETPMHGYQIITELSERSGGDWRPSAGSVYPTLQQLTDEGLVRDQERDGRRVYELTESGRAEAERTKTAVPPWQAADKDGTPDLRRVAAQVMSATMQVARDGDPAMQARAYELLAECRRSIYRLLADDDTTVAG